MISARFLDFAEISRQIAKILQDHGISRISAEISRDFQRFPEICEDFVGFLCKCTRFPRVTDPSACGM